MGLTSALNTSLTGLSNNETAIDVLGNNIANASTNGYKESQVQFTTQLARTLSSGSGPTADNGGTNPRQVGLGATTAAIRQDFTQGSVTTSSSPSDLAIQGDGFFIADGGDGTVYTRDGAFSLNSQNVLTNPQGLRVQGYGIDDDFNLVQTQLTDLQIPLGELNVAQQTEDVSLRGALLSTGDVATQGSQLFSETLTDTSTGLNATAASNLVDLEDPAGNTLFNNGETISFTGKKGGRKLETQSLGPIDATTQLSDLITLMDNTIGIHSGGTIPDDPNAGPGQPGIDVVGGQIRITGNMGTVNDLSIGAGDLTADGNTVPLSFTKTESADGESTLTDFIIFDSLGQSVDVKVSAVLESRTSTSSTFRYFVESNADSDADVVVSDGTFTFDGVGNLVDGGSATFNIDRDNTAAVSPMQVDIDFSEISGISKESAGSRLTLAFQDGAAPGTLTDFSVEESGVITGSFDNGISRPLGQVVLARFANPQGLLSSGKGTFEETGASGAPTLATPGTFGAGTVRAGAIELSNTDVGGNLLDLITASSNFRGNARVISVVQELVDELLLLQR